MKLFTIITTVVLMTCASLFAQVDLDNGLVAFYTFNGDATDVSGNGNDGTVSIGHANWGAGTPRLTTDRFGNADKAYYFDQGGNIEVPYSTILNPTSMSLSWWVNMEAQDNNDYMISMNRWHGYKVNLQDSDLVFFTAKVDDPDNAGETIIYDRDHAGDGLVADTWYHLAVSFGGGHMKFYIDGVMVKDWDDVLDANIVDLSGDPVNLIFGQDLPTDVYADDGTHDVAWGGFFKGTMDDIRIYNRVLTDAEVLALSIDLDGGLVASYPFSGNANDASGNGNDGTVSIGHANWGAGTPVLTTDRFGNADKAYYFDQGGNIEVPYSTILNPTSMSLSWWINMEAQDNNDYMISMNRWHGYKVNLQDIDRVFFTAKVDDPDNAGETIIYDRDHAGDGLVADTWYHLAVSFGNGHMKFYIDGVMVKDWDDVLDANIVDLSGDPVNLIFGQDLPTDVYADDGTHDVAWGGFFKGVIDDIKIYNRVLTDNEVTALYELPDAGLEEGLVAYYPFTGNANDASGNGNDGTVSIGHANWGAGTPVLTTDMYGNTDEAYYFDQGGNIEVPYSTILNPTSMSLSWWINMEAQDNNDYMISMNRWHGYKVNLQDIDRVFFTAKVDDPDNAGETIIYDRDHAGDGLVADTWYHLAVSFGNGHMKFYIDGVMVKDWDDVLDANIVDLSGDPVNLIFGQDLPTDVYADDGTHDVSWGGFFKGKMDEIRIYNRVLTDAEVLTLSESTVSVEEPRVFNRTFELLQNYPNPFKSSTTIEFTQQEKGFATLKVFNVMGQEVATLVSQNQIPGKYTTIWDASEMSTGVYFYRLSIDDVEQTKKLYLLK